MDEKTFLSALFAAAVDRADPMRNVSSHLPERPMGRLIVIGAGKASARMAEAVEAHYGACEGLVITRYGYARPCTSIDIIEAAHPIPDESGFRATARMLDLIHDLSPDDLVIALISGGGSALMCAPVAGVTLEDMKALNVALLASGAPISQMNIVRKQISRVKGGRLAVACAPARMLCLMISDVPGDDPGEIASGPSVGHLAGPDQAREVLDRWHIMLPPDLRRAIIDAPEPIAPDDPRLAHCVTQIIAAPKQSLEAAAHLARSQGVDVRILGDALEGEARDLGASQAAMAQQIAQGMVKGDAPILLLSGGECTVTIRGGGIGGPKAEYVLAAAIALDHHPRVHVLACDTDGVDGGAEVAGAYAGPDTLRRAKQSGIDPRSALVNNNAHGFFAKLNDQIITGPTLTNVNDFRGILIHPPQ